MNIGIDIDGVLNNSKEILQAYGNYYDMTVVKGIGAISPKEYNLKNFFGWTDAQYEGFIKKYYEELLQNAVVKPMAIAVLNKLKKEGNNIYIVTSRNSKLHENIVQLTQTWLIGSRIPFDKLIMECDDKLSACKEKGIEIMVEDDPEQCMKIAEEIPVICFNDTYNENIEGENINRALDWVDVYKIIEKKRWKG